MGGKESIQHQLDIAVHLAGLLSLSPKAI